MKFLFGSESDKSRSAFRKDFVKVYNFTFIILAALLTGIVVTPPPLKALASRYLYLVADKNWPALCPFSPENWHLFKSPLIWLLECIALAGAVIRVFQIYTHLDEKWQSKLSNFPPPANDPVAKYNEGFDKEVNGLRCHLKSALIFLLSGLVLILLRACISEN